MPPKPPHRSRLLTVAKFVRRDDLEDARQVAWLAFLERRDPARAVDTWRRNRQITKARERTNNRGI